MAKRIVVAGCRDYENYEEAKAFLESCIGEMSLLMVAFSPKRQFV